MDQERTRQNGARTCSESDERVGWSFAQIRPSRPAHDSSVRVHYMHNSAKQIFMVPSLLRNPPKKKRPPRGQGCAGGRGARLRVAPSAADIRTGPRLRLSHRLPCLRLSHWLRQMAPPSVLHPALLLPIPSCGCPADATAALGVPHLPVWPGPVRLRRSAGRNGLVPLPTLSYGCPTSRLRRRR